MTDQTRADDWNNLTFPAQHAGDQPIIEAYERVCVEGNGNHGQVVVSSKCAPNPRVSSATRSVR